MAIYKNKDTILKHCPVLTDKDIQLINEKCFKPYLFFEDGKDSREFWCTHCNAHFEIPNLRRTMKNSGREYELMTATHSPEPKTTYGCYGCSSYYGPSYQEEFNYATCPHCGTSCVTKQTGKAKHCNNLDKWRTFVHIKPQGEAVYLICGYAHREYNYHCYDWKPSVDVSTIYYLVPGIARKFKSNYYGGFYEVNRIGEPFTKTWYYNISNDDYLDYTVLGEEKLEKTFLKYCQLKNFSKKKNFEYFKYQITSYLGVCAENPNTVEMMMKVGLDEFVKSKIDGSPMKRTVNWNGKNPKEVLKKLTPQETRAFMRDSDRCPGTYLSYLSYKPLYKGITFAKVGELDSKLSCNKQTILSIVKKSDISLTHVWNYLQRQQKKSEAITLSTACQWLKDYLDFAKELKYDLSRTDVLLPKNLKEAHDHASEALTVIKDEKAFSDYQKRYKKLQKMYEYSDGEYQIVIPMGINDIVEEGKILSHCVGGYADRHVRGATTIVFMRMCNAPDERLVTIEVSDKDKHISQNYGYKDRQVTKKEKQFIDEWIAWVKAGSKKTKVRNKNNKNEAA